MNEWTPDYDIKQELRREIAALRRDIDALKCERAELVEALRPFARVAEHDIGEDETDHDRFRPMFSVNCAPPILVGDMRRAATLLSRYGR